MVVGDEDFKAGGGKSLGGEVAEEIGQVFSFVAGGDENRELRIQ